MTANTLSIEQRCEVARAVTDQPWKYLHGHIILDGDKKLHYWNPRFEAEDWMRSQALALVEWLVVKTKQPDPSIHACHWADEIWLAIISKDTAALESMVFQTTTKGKEDEIQN